MIVQSNGKPQTLATDIILNKIAEIGPLSLRLSRRISACTCVPVEKVTLWVGFLYLTSGSETGEGVAKDEVFARTGNRTRDSRSRAQYAIH